MSANLGSHLWVFVYHVLYAEGKHSERRPVSSDVTHIGIVDDRPRTILCSLITGVTKCY